MTHGTCSGYTSGCRCKLCKRAIADYNAKWRSNNHDRFIKRHRLHQRRKYDKFLELTNSIKLEKGCADCGYKEYAVALQFDHVRGNKEFTISRRHFLPKSKILAEISKCEVVCANCHAVRTWKRKQHGAMR